MKKKKANPHMGGSFDDFLSEEGLLAEAESMAVKRVIAFQIHSSSLLAYDAYTGRLLWKQAVDPFTRYACLDDGIYVAGGNQLRVLDPATGRESLVFSCVNQDQPLDCVDFHFLHQRLRQNSAAES